jgi:hypothetical protein
MSVLKLSSRPSFSGHESFPVRYGWLKKGFDAIEADPAILSSDHAMVELGVGKNMVRAIRHWGIAFRIWEPAAGGRGSALEPTHLGRMLLGDGGWDPFVDEIGTVWLLHSWLVGQPDHATTPWYFFARARVGAFKKAEIVGELEALSAAWEGGRITARATIERDFDVSVRLFAHARTPDAEDALDSPLTSLELIHPTREPGGFALSLGGQPSLPDGVFTAYFLRWLARDPRPAIPFDDVRHAPGSPGRIFRLAENALMDRLAALVQWVPAVQFDETAGIRQLLIRGELPSEESILIRHYQRAE